MSDFYIYPSRYEKLNEYDEFESVSVTLIFCPAEQINENNLQNEIKEFYEKNYQTDEIIVVGGEYHQDVLNEIIITNQLSTFKHIPKLETDHLSKSIQVITFNKDGKLKCYNKSEENVIKIEIIKDIINSGLVNIFNSRGGLIEAKGDAHHFVFPSGKHCDKFLRTGNVLMNTSEIYFIAFCLLERFIEEEHEKIFCDTSSINTLAFAIIELKRRFIPTLNSIPIESFSSYDGLFSKTVRFFENSLILISSSTSGNIIDRIIDHDDTVNSENICIIYFLGTKKDFKKRENHVICNLTKSKKNPTGITLYDTFSERECGFCKRGSYPVEVKGDVFLLEKPKINRITIKVTDAPKRLSEFVKQFRSDRKINNNVFKVNYKETSDTNKKYEIYFDIYHILSHIDNTESVRYSKYKSKLFDYINQYIPSNTKYLITLPDEGSLKLSQMIIKQIKANYKEETIPQIVEFDNVTSQIINKEIEGAAVIVGSCISNGKNLLYLSRAFRNYEKLKLVYFIGLARTNNQEDLEFLKSNLKQGNYGKETNSVIEVESFYCNKDSKDTSWIIEKEFLLSELKPLAERKELLIAKKKIEDRIELIDNSFSNQVKGLANSLFYPNSNDEDLHLRKGFAFINFERSFEDVSQADVYFAMSAIINQLRNTDNYFQCLKQSEYVRNLLDPGNFNRFNDGIIQASILRAARQSELAYHIDEDASLNMELILEKIISEHHTPQGEGLIEFLYSISVEKLTLKRDHLGKLVALVDSICDNELIKLFNFYIKENFLSDKPTFQETIEKLEKEITELKNELEATKAI